MEHTTNTNDETAALSHDLVEIEDNKHSNGCIFKRKPILKETLSPMLALMRCFGLYYEEEKGNINCPKVIINKIYVFFILTVLVGMLAQSIAGVFYIDKTNGYYSIAVDMIFRVKSLGHAIAMVQICRQKKLWKLVSEFDTFLSKIRIERCTQQETNYSKSLWKWLALFVFFMLFCIFINVMMMLFATKEFQFFETIQLKPFNVSTGTRVYKIFCLTVLLGAWFLPVTLCAVLLQSMVYLFDEFYRYMKAESGEWAASNLCVKRYIKEVRVKFFRLTELAGKVDSMFNLILLISYLTDICLVCLTLRLGIFTFTTPWGKFFIFSWLMPPLFSLLALSHHSSKLYDKGQQMSNYVQFFNTTEVTLDTKIQFDMLLFHLSTEPVVMTIWKMIPLYRSIIISVVNFIKGKTKFVYNASLYVQYERDKEVTK